MRMSKITDWWDHRTKPETITKDALSKDKIRIWVWSFMFVLYGFFIGMDWKRGSWTSLGVDVFFALLFYWWLAETWTLYQRRKQALERKGQRDQHIKDLTGQ